jgi:hypothetical protein
VFEGQVADEIRVHGTANISVELVYGNGGTRPSAVIYTANWANRAPMSRMFGN